MTEDEIRKSLNASLQNSLSKYKEDQKDKEEQKFLPKVANTLQDIGVQTIGGIVDASESAYNFVVPKSMEVEYSDIVPEAETPVGAFIRPASQFFIPYTGAFKIAKGGYMYVKNAKNLNDTVKKLITDKKIKSKDDIITKKDKDKFTILKKGTTTKTDYIPVTTVRKKPPTTSNEVLMGQLGMGGPKTVTVRGVKKVVTKKDTTKKIAERDLEKTLTKGETAGLAIGAGAVSDAIAFAPYDPNLADFLVRFPATKNALTEWLQTDPNGDPGMERLKNAISGGIPSVFIPPFLAGVSKGFVWSKNKIGQKAVQELEKKLDTSGKVKTVKEPKKVKSKEEETRVDEQTEDAFKLKPNLKSKYVMGQNVALKSNSVEKLKTNFFNSNVVKRFTIDFLDSNRGLKYLEEAASKQGVSVKRLKNLYSEGLGVYQEARFLPAIGGMVEHFLFKGTFRYNDAGQMVGTANDGLQSLLQKTLGKKHNSDEFFNYAGTKSVLSMNKAKFEGLFPDAKIRDQIKKDAKMGDAIPEYQAALKELDRFNRELIDLAVDAELISRKTADKLLNARKHYVPLYRDMSVDENFVSRARGGGVAVKRKLEAKVPIGFGKDQLPLRNLFDNYVENINSIITASYKNKVLRNTFDLIDEGT